MKKKITALALVICLMATAVVGATLAYFTDTSSATNTFTVGNVDIEVSETNAINGEAIDGTQFTNVMPGDEITKTAVVTNNSSDYAYVRVVVHLNHHLGLYYMLGLDEQPAEADALAATRSVLPGWDFQPKLVEGWYGMWYESLKGSAPGVEVISVDEVMINNQSGKYFASANNYFINEIESTNASGGLVALSNNHGSTYYDCIVNHDHVAWVYYLKMAPRASYTLFEGINPSADFGEAEMSFFDDNLSLDWQQEDLKISVCADAIQSTGFEVADGEDVAKVAFEALEEAHPLSSWKLG